MPILSSTSMLDPTRLNGDRASSIPTASSDAMQASGPSPFQRMLDRRADEQLQRSQSDDGTPSDTTAQASGRQADNAHQDASPRDVTSQPTSGDADRAAHPAQAASSGRRADGTPMGTAKSAKTDGLAARQAGQAQGGTAQGSSDAQSAAADGVTDATAATDAPPAGGAPRAKAAADALSADTPNTQGARHAAPDPSGAAPDPSNLMAAALQGQTLVHAAGVPVATEVGGKGTAGEAFLALHRLQMAQTGRSFLGDPARGAGAPAPDVGGTLPNGALNPFSALGGDTALGAATDAKAHPGFQDLLSSRTAAPVGPDAATPDLAALGAAAAAGASGGHVAGAGGTDKATAGVPQYGIDAPVGTAGFASALGDRLTWMVKDGQTQAQLKLNPEQLGPIVVDIQMQGAMAHVSFTAAHDATRAAIESSMPQLASALQSEGLSLGGANVQAQTQQDARPRSDDTAPSGTGRSASGADAQTAVSAAVPRARSARANGVLDLYA